MNIFRYMFYEECEVRGDRAFTVPVIFKIIINNAMMVSCLFLELFLQQQARARVGIERKALEIRSWG